MIRTAIVYMLANKCIDKLFSRINVACNVPNPQKMTEDECIKAIVKLVLITFYYASDTPNKQRVPDEFIVTYYDYRTRLFYLWRTTNNFRMMRCRANAMIRLIDRIIDLNSPDSVTEYADDALIETEIDDLIIYVKAHLMEFNI